MADDSSESEAPGNLDTKSDDVATSDTSVVTEETEAQSNPPAVEESEPASTAREATFEPSPATNDSETSPATNDSETSPATNDSETSPATNDSETSPATNDSETSPATNVSETDSSARETTEFGQIAAQLIPHILNLYGSCPTAADFDALYAPNAVFEDPLMQAHGVAQIKSAFYAMPKVFLDSTVLKYTVEEEQTTPTSGEIRLYNLQQYKLLQLGPVGYYITMRSLIKLTVEGGKVIRHEDLWGEYRLWNRHTVWVPLVGRLAETMRKGNMLLTHVLMGFGKDHKTLDKPSGSLHLKVA